MFDFFSLWDIIVLKIYKKCIFNICLCSFASVVGNGKEKFETYSNIQKGNQMLKVTFKRWIVSKLNKFCYFVHRQVRSVNDFERYLNQGSESGCSKRNLLVMYLEGHGSAWKSSNIQQRNILADIVFEQWNNQTLKLICQECKARKEISILSEKCSKCERYNISHSDKGHVEYWICWMVTKALPVANKCANIFPVKAQKSQWIHNLFV